MFGKIVAVAVAILSVLGAMLYKIVYKARGTEHDNEHNKGIHG
jgi:hypothetical protein